MKSYKVVNPACFSKPAPACLKPGGINRALQLTEKMIPDKQE
jgi:hypothetical protein